MKPRTNQNPSFVKGQIVNALRATISLLEGVVNQLEPQPQPSSIDFASTDTDLFPPSTSIETTAVKAESESLPVKTDEEVLLPGDLIESISIEFEPTIQPVTPPPPPPEVKSPPTPEKGATPPKPTPSAKPPKVKPPLTPEKVSRASNPTLVDRFLPSFDRLQAWRVAILQRFRSLLPQSLNQQLSDWTITGAIAVSLIFLLWTAVALIPGKSTEVATVPSPEIKAPAELKAPSKPEPIEIAPPPPPVLTPEQNLIASIQNQVAEITNQYAGGLIDSVEANFSSRRLIVKVSQGWYQLNSAKQDKLADEMLRRSHDLDFIKFQILDPEGNLVARNPVVGSHMVVLLR